MSEELRPPDELKREDKMTGFQTMMRRASDSEAALLEGAQEAPAERVKPPHSLPLPVPDLQAIAKLGEALDLDPVLYARLLERLEATDDDELKGASARLPIWLKDRIDVYVRHCNDHKLFPPHVKKLTIQLAVAHFIVVGMAAHAMPPVKQRDL